MKQRITALIVAVILSLSLCACSDVFGNAVPEQPVLSHASGRYDGSFTLTVTAGKGATVRYTLDGSEPTAESPEFPAEGLLIENISIVGSAQGDSEGSDVRLRRVILLRSDIASQ